MPASIPFTIGVSGSAQTGGPEALHQLAATLVAQGHKAQMLYLGRIEPAVVAHYRQRYGLPSTSRPDDCHGSHLVLPEVEDPRPWRGLPFASHWVWWLSELRHHPLRSYEGWGFLFQSRAIQTAFSACGQPGLLLTDYVVDVYRSPAPTGPRGPIIAFSGQRTAAAAALALRGGSFQLKTIVGLDTMGVLEVLDSASVYLDMGWHPGMDRGPREAALRGCVVLVNRARNAADPGDMPLPDQYKIDWLDRLGLIELIADACADRDRHLRAQMGYRTWIEGDRNRFAEQVRTFASMAAKPPPRAAADSAGLDRWQIDQSRDLVHLLRNLNSLAAENLLADAVKDTWLAENAELRVATAPRLVRGAMRLNAWLRRLKGKRP